MRRARRGLLTRWELGIGLVLLAATLAYVLPIAQRATWRTRRAEVGYLLESLQKDQAAWRITHGAWFDVPMVPAAPDAIGTHRTPWPSKPIGGWTPPTRMARGAYWTSRTETGALQLHGTCDVDGDGIRAVYVASPRGEIRRLTPEDVY